MIVYFIEWNVRVGFYIAFLRLYPSSSPPAGILASSSDNPSTAASASFWALVLLPLDPDAALGAVASFEAAIPPEVT